MLDHLQPPHNLLRLDSVQHEFFNNGLANDNEPNSTQNSNETKTPLSLPEVSSSPVQTDYQQILEYITHCITFLVHIQTCAEYDLKESEVKLALEHALNRLRPKSDLNLRVFKEIEDSVATIVKKLFKRNKSNS